MLFGSALLIVFVLLIYFQLRFYREGDLKHGRSQEKPVSAHTSSAPGFLKSAHHRAIWTGIDQTRHLMRHKEREFFQEQMKREKQAIGLPQEEEIVFMADRARFSIWPAALTALVCLAVAAFPSEEPSSAGSFACIVLGLLGLLALTAARFPDRTYLTNFRVLARKRRPLHREQWFSMNYRRIAAISRRKKLVSEQLTLKSDDAMIEIKGLSNRTLQIMLSTLRQNCACK